MVVRLNALKKLFDLPPISDGEEVKTIMYPVFIPEDYNLELYKKYHALKMISTMEGR